MAAITEQQLDAYLSGETELKDLVDLDPDYLEQIKGRAQFFVDGGHTERALIMLEMLEELDRKDPLPSLLAIDLLLGDGRSDDAEAKIDMLQERHPNSPDVAVARAQLLVQTGQLVGAAALLEGVLAADPEATTDAGQRARALAARAHDQFESA